jgi:hypothetical protein
VVAVADVFSTPRIATERRNDGVLLVRSEEELGLYAASMAELFRAGSEAHPERTLAAQRDGGAWRTLLGDPPDIDAGEITDKGYINQRRVLEQRSEREARLYETPRPADVVSA